MSHERRAPDFRAAEQARLRHASIDHGGVPDTREIRFSVREPWRQIGQIRAAACFSRHTGGWDVNPLCDHESRRAEHRKEEQDLARQDASFDSAARCCAYDAFSAQLNSPHIQAALPPLILRSVPHQRKRTVMAV